MCGITGFLVPEGFREHEASVVACRMRDRLVHRGPDDSGVWLDGSAGIALAHRRLSILDLSPAGHQPMHSASGRYVLVFNGEIYNHQNLRRKLEGEGFYDWQGHSDTETLLVAIERWGLEMTLQKLVGMFALALWDREARVLYLARDRLGEKPLYYGWHGGTLLFGSELKALQAHSDLQLELDRDVLPLYLRYGYIPAPWSIWKGIHKLIPGSFVQLSAEQTKVISEPTPYWTLAETIAQGQAHPFVGSDGDAITALETQLHKAVAGQRISDVPLGAFLSGGIDSSTIVALMRSQSSQPVKTFTIGFDEAGYNEAKHAKAVAAHLGTEHTELYVTANQALEVIPKLAEMFDEPFGDSSAIPTYLVSQLARQHVTVSLSGDGGDELFAGYGRYFNDSAEQIWQVAKSLPLPLRKLAVVILRSPAAAIADSALRTLTQSVRRSFGKSFSARAELVAALLECRQRRAFYRTMTSQWKHPPVSQKIKEMPYGIADTLLDRINEPVQQMMATDSLTYLPDDILAKVDRAAMAVSLETRVPMLDHRVVELAWRMPYSMKVRDGQGKWLLRQVLYRHVPRSIIERPKMGFGVPVDQWLRGPLRDWAEDLLSEESLRAQGFFNPEPIRRRWEQHVKGHHNWKDSLWLVLIWQAWVRSSQTGVQA